MDTAMLGNSGYDRREKDAYWTEPRVTEAILGRIGLASGLVWEPACGRGDMVQVLHERGYQVVASDVERHWDVDLGCRFERRDFFAYTEAPRGISSIFTNPPFDHVERFVRHALELTEPMRGMVVVVLRNEWDCAGGRRDLFEHQAFSAKYILTFRPRWDWWGRDKSKASPRHPFSWFVWDWANDGERPTIGWLP